MELNKQKIKSPKSRTSKKQPDYTDITIFGTPMPQATSTVDRRSISQDKPHKYIQDEENHTNRQLNFNSSNVTLKTEESSLGIIQNISTLLDENPLQEYKFKENPDHERELARKVLMKCNDPLNGTLSKLDKENNVNSSNLPKSSNYCNYPMNIKNLESTITNELTHQQKLIKPNKLTNSSSIVFEPTEITARSSELNKTPENSEQFSKQSFSGISYDSKLAELMAEYGDEEFMSGSKAGSQILADELSWRKNNIGALPNNNYNNKNNLETSCFSGIIDDTNITVDGGRVSVGEFFKRKCGGTGHLSTTTGSDRPSFGLDAQSPQRKGMLRPLVDDTLITDGSYLQEEQESKSGDCTKEQSVMSLSTIAQILQNIDSATPRKLVDQILDANKKKRKENKNKIYSVGDTYTLMPKMRASLPSPAHTPLSEKPERNIRKNNFGSKLSLGSKYNTEFDTKSFNNFLSSTTNLDPKLRSLLEMNLDDSLPETQESENKQISPNRSIPRAEQIMPPPKKLSHLPNSRNKFINSPCANNQSSLILDTGPTDLSDQSMMKNDSTTREDTLTNSLLKNQSFDTKKVEIGKKTQELCTCLVGIPKEADFELYNGTDRWILCSIKLHQLQGEKDNIEFILPTDDILIEPDARKSFKIGVKMPRLEKLTIAIFHIPCSDMVTRTSWLMKHLMCFVPEKPNIKISLHTEDGTLDFKTITEDKNHQLPVTFENLNSIDVPIMLCLNQESPQLFSFCDDANDIEYSKDIETVSSYLTLKPKQPSTVNIDFSGISLASFGAKVLKKGMHVFEAQLNVYICFKEKEEVFIQQIPLKGVIGSCKLDVVDTQFPLILQPALCKIISLKNSGSITVSGTIDVVESKDNPSECKDFFICPNNIVLNGGENLTLQITYKPESKTDNERRVMIRITVENKIYFYPIIGDKRLESDQFLTDSSHQLQRSETPQHLRPISSPTSPHSLVFNRSGTSGRHSPGSTISGGTVAVGVIPIRASEIALVWGSIKIGKSDTKSLIVLNTSNNKIKLLVNIKSVDHNFKFLKDRQTLASSIILTLQGMENKTLSVVFSPNSPKAAAGKIIFSYYNSLNQREIKGLAKVITLYGYGGYGKIEISEAVKDTSGQMWLSLGKLNTEGILNAKIKLHNTGDLTCFSSIKLIPKTLHPSVVSNWHIEPTDILLYPNQTEWITLEFRPRKDDLTTLHQNGVIQVGTLKIIHGDEPTRLRIRRLYKKLKDNNQLHDKIDEHADEFKEIIHRISKAFPREMFTPDLKLIGDSVQNLGELCKGIVQNEIKLTIEIYLDETISMLQDNIDDSQIFYSLCSDHDNISHYGGESFLPDD